MDLLPHTAVYTDNKSRKDVFARSLLKGRLPAELSFLSGLSGGLFSNGRIADFLEEEARHEFSELNPERKRQLRTFSSGERKKALLRYLLKDRPDFLILDDPFDNLDREFQEAFRIELMELSGSVILIQLLSRPADRLEVAQQSAFLEGEHLTGFPDYDPAEVGSPERKLSGTIPAAPEQDIPIPRELVRFSNVSVRYGDTPILNEISWIIRRGEFWELRGPNGSGKTTLITMITGDNPKAYGQDMALFGIPKGSGESVWEIKERIGYFTPAMTDRFSGQHTVSNMLISGLTDSVGLYVRPGDAQRQLAAQWLRLLGMESLGQTYFRDLTAGQQRLVLCARAMIKHPPLLILDEPTAGLDQQAALLVVALIRKMAGESRTAIIFVSHRQEPGLQADQVFELMPSKSGSTGEKLL